MQPIRRTDQVSEKMFDVIQKSIIQHRALTNQMKQANGDMIEALQENAPIEDPMQIPLSDAMASGKFEYKQFGLYKEADTDDAFGRIWVKKDIIDPKTGTKEEWLVVYTNDEQELIRQVANDKLRELKTAAQPNPKDIPIAQGIKSKNITIDESGASGTAKVTVEFTNVDQGLKFYQEDVAGGNKAEAPAEDQKSDAPAKGEEAADKPPATTPATPAPGGPPQVGPGPMPQMGQASLKSDGIKKVADGVMNEGGGIPLPSGDTSFDAYPNDTTDIQAQDAFGQMLMSGDRVKDETGRKGVIESVVDMDNARVKWDSSDLANEGFGGEFSLTQGEVPEDFIPGTAVEVVPTMSLTKWANTTIRKMTKAGAQVMDIIKNVYPNEVKYSFVNEGGFEVDLDITSDLRTGAQIQRPDTKQIARVGNFIVQRFADINTIADEILADLDLEIPGTVEDASVVAKKKWSPPWLDKKDDDDDEESDDDEKKASLKKKAQFTSGDSVAYHGREGRVLDYDGGFYIVHFEDTGEDESIDEDELLYQNGLYQQDDFFNPKNRSHDDIVASLVKEALDVSDQVAPMSWKSEGNDNNPAGAGPSLPPKNDLQFGQGSNPATDPNNPAGAQPIYDSAKGQGPSFQTTVNPDDRSVTVKFVDNVQQQKLDQTVQQTAPTPTAPIPNPAAPQGVPGVGAGPAPSFDDLNSPNQF